MAVFAVFLTARFTMAANWFLVINGKRHGPFTASAIRQMVKRGEIRPDTQAWRPGRNVVTQADLVPVASLTAHARRLAERPAYAGAWMSLICHVLSLFFFLTSHPDQPWYTSPQWWMGLAITTGFLMSAIWGFESDYSHISPWPMWVLTSAYCVVTAACLPLVMDGTARGDAITLVQVMHEYAGNMLLVIWGAAITHLLVKLYGSRRIVTFVTYVQVLALVAAGVVMMGHYVVHATDTSVSLKTTVEIGFFMSFALISLIGARMCRSDHSHKMPR